MHHSLMVSTAGLVYIRSMDQQEASRNTELSMRHVQFLIVFFNFLQIHCMAALSA